MFRQLVALTALTVATVGVCSPAKSITFGESDITDMQKILSTAAIVNQKSGAEATDSPGLPAPKTYITAKDGHLVSPDSLESQIPGVAPSVAVGAARRPYVQVFGGSGTGFDNRDAAVKGTAYLTYKTVPNSTYNVEACLNFCDTVPGCVFVNLYYEYNNVLLDYVFPEHSNLKCAAFGDYHDETDKTNYGGQPFNSQMNLTYIQNSSGYAVGSPGEPETPARYSARFGPISAASIASGYMGFVFLDRYDVNACAQLCNAREQDAAGGRCKFFNIWRAEVNRSTTTYTCSMYNLETDASTATNTGQDTLNVKDSRGYAFLNSE